MWPNGQRRPPSVPRTEEQKLKTKEDAYLKLSALMPGADGFLLLVGSHIELTLSLSPVGCRRRRQYDRPTQRPPGRKTSFRRPPEPSA